MTRKRILNIVTAKKRDTMVPVTNGTLNPTNPSSTLPAILTPGKTPPTGTPAYTYCIPWIPTARQTASGSAPGAQLAKLTSGHPYMVGLSERITVSTTGPVPWQWRRICFTFKGPDLYGNFVDPLTDIEYRPQQYYRESFDNDVGEFRPLYDIASYGGEGAIPGRPRALEKLYRTLFLGASSQFDTNANAVDWINVMDAKTDSSRVKICYDKTVSISSGNEEGVQRQYKRYHAMNKNLQYDQLEIGGNYVFSDYSTSGKPGMGDYYVIDLFQARYASGADAGNLIFDPRATMYWHEK